MTGQAGEGARRKAEQVASAADVLERKAAKTRRMADNYAAGAVGEAAVETALAPLSASGWYVLHDRVMPTGGNIDHIVVGPGAVIVLDAKAWNGQLEIRNGRLYISGWHKKKEVDHLAAQAEAVRAALGIDQVNRALVITTQPEFEPVVLEDGAGVLGLGFLLTEIDQTPTSYSTTQVEQMLATLVEAFPVAGTAPPASSGLQVMDGVEVDPLFDRANRFLYLKQWKKYGKHRVYLKDEFGEELGFKDYVTGDITLTAPDDRQAAAVLAAATPTGLQLAAGDLPKLPIDVRGGRLLGLFGRLYATVMVGSLWEAKGKRYLYCTLANPTDGVFDLGHVDMATGWVKPKIVGPVSRDRGPAERYLALLRDRSPL
ncbi:hypothetical protein BH10ACT3_BH10ACT3_00350 [soil metagenome]